MAFAAAGHPPEVPLTCESGAQGGDPVGSARGRWLKKSSWKSSDQERRQGFIVESRDSAHGVGALARVLWRRSAFEH